MSFVIYMLFFFDISLALTAYLYFSRRGCATAFLWLATLMYFGIGLIDLPNAARIFSMETVITALAFAALGSLLLFFLLYSLYSILSDIAGVTVGTYEVSPQLSELQQASVGLKWLFVPLLLAIPITMLVMFGPDAFHQTWEVWRLEQSKFAIVHTLLAETLAILPGAFWVAKQRAWAVMSLVAVVLVSAATGGRLTAVIAIASMYLALLFRHGPRAWLQLLPLAILPAALGLHVLLRLTRGIDAYDLIVGLFDGTTFDTMASAASAGLDMFGGERTPFRSFYYLVETRAWQTFPEMLQTIQRILFVWLPHEISHKPVDVVDLTWQRALDDGYMAYVVSMDFGSDTEKYEALMRAVDQGSLHATLWGEALANGGYFAAVPVIFFLALLFALEEVIIAKLSPVSRFGLMTLMTAQFMYVARGTTVTGFTHFVFVGTIWCSIVFAMTYPLLGRSTLAQSR